VIETDIIISCFLLFWGLYGLVRGFITELISFICWAVAIYVSANYFHVPTNIINEHLNNPHISRILAFILIFLSTFIVSAILGFLLSKMIGLFGLGVFNRVFGLVFGLLKGSVFIIITIFILDLTDFRENIFFQESQYISFFDGIINEYLSDTSSLFDEMGLSI
tara:strand:- start:308 stop:799 length:492 start_codon:yes stop_codon:yes gene_type:complete